MRTGCFSPLSLRLAAAAGAVLLGAWLLGGGGLFSPGELNAERGAVLGGVASHAELAGRCGACHAAPWSGSTMNELCLRCHADLRAQLADTASLHGSLADAADCRACHSEHAGPAASPTRWRSSMAGGAGARR